MGTPRVIFCPCPIPGAILQLRSPGARVLEELLGGISAVGSLDLSDNGEKREKPHRGDWPGTLPLSPVSPRTSLRL